MAQEIELLAISAVTGEGVRKLIQRTAQLLERIKKKPPNWLKSKQLIINNVLESQECNFCRVRSEGQKKYINLIKEIFKDFSTVIIPLEAKEVKGIESLEKFGRRLFK